jgi:hypothetical protein
VTVRARLGRLARVSLFALAVCASAGVRTAAAEGEGSLFVWRPSVRMTTVVDDNIGLEDGSGEGSVGFWVTPRLQLDYRGESVRAGTDLAADVRRYLDGGSKMDDELYRAVGWVEVGLTQGLALHVSNAYVPQPVMLGRPEDEVLNLTQSNRAEGGLRWATGLPGNRELRAGAVGTWFLTDDYPELVPSGGGLVLDPDFEATYAQGLGFVEVESPLGESTSVSARGQFSYRAFAEADYADHTNLSLLMALRSQPYERLRLELSGGAGAIGMDGFADALRALGRAEARFQAWRGGALWIAAGHLHSPDLSGDEVDETTGEIGLEQRFGPATLASLRVFATRYDGNPLGGVDVFGAAEVKLRRQLTRHLQVGIAYRHWRNAGSLDIDDFRQNRIALEIGVRR